MAVKESKDKCYYCGECKLAYRNKKKAYECERWCKKYKSCNLKITKNSLYFKKI
ncbi:MAG: hypothetical protein QW727_03140 [Candidatus Pacearchaeota archaeon]